MGQDEEDINKALTLTKPGLILAFIMVRRILQSPICLCFVVFLSWFRIQRKIIIVLYWVPQILRNGKKKLKIINVLPKIISCTNNKIFLPF